MPQASHAVKLMVAGAAVDKSGSSVEVGDGNVASPGAGPVWMQNYLPVV